MSLRITLSYSMFESSPNRSATGTTTYASPHPLPGPFSNRSSSKPSSKSNSNPRSSFHSNFSISTGTRSTTTETDTTDITSTTDTDPETETDSDSNSDSNTTNPPTIWILFPLGKNPKFLHNLPKLTETQLATTSTPNYYNRVRNPHYTVNGIKGDVGLFLETIHGYCQVPRRRAKVSLDFPPSLPFDLGLLCVVVKVPGWEGVNPIWEMERILEMGFMEVVRLGRLIEKGEVGFEDVIYGGIFGGYM